MLKPKVYRKLPVEVTAVRWSGTSANATEIINWILSLGGTATFYCRGTDPGKICDGKHTLRIHTLEGTMEALPGDYIILGVAGEFYPCKPDIFKRTYEVKR